MVDHLTLYSIIFKTILPTMPGVRSNAVPIAHIATGQVSIQP